MQDTLGIYVHIPFCRSKCPYCDFFSMRGNDDNYRNYVNILKEKIKYWADKTDKIVDTIYIGGGTPSVLSADDIADIILTIKNEFNSTELSEVTMEANPSSAKSFVFSKAVSAGLNRVSLGIQSINANELKTLGRIHNINDIEKSIKNIRSANISNLSFDIMLGIPEQTIKSLKNTIDFCIQNNVEHISAYILKLEENTVFYNRRDKYDFPNDDKTAELYSFTVNYLEQNGYLQYEISNFCKKGYESIHNLKYWNLDNYLGIGPAAHSFLDGKRFYYERSIENFANDIIIDDGAGGDEDEYIMLKLRLKSGLNITKYKEAFGKFPAKSFFDKVEKYHKTGYMEFDGDTIKFTTKGFLVSNTILSDLI